MLSEICGENKGQCWLKLAELFVLLYCSLIDATHKDVDVLLLLSNSAYYVA